MDREEVEIEGNSEPNQQSSGQISHLALDIGGSLIKLVYFSRNNNNSVASKAGNASSNGNSRTLVVDGQIHFKRFETSKINDCIEFIHSRKLHLGGVQHHEAPTSDKIMIKATGGGACMFADLFKEKLGVFLDKEDEMDCLVAGANFLLKAVHHEAFTYMDGRKEFVQIHHDDLYPYLLVNIGSGVSMLKVDGDGKFERVSGTSVGGGTFWGLGRLLTRCKSFDELLELSHQGNNRVVDMLVGDIYGGTDYSKIGLSATAIASSFGKAISNDKELEDYKPEDIARSLLRMISNNIGQISYLNALRFGLRRIFFGGFFIRGQAYTMDTISVAVKYWSKGEAKAMFLEHEGFLGALGAFLSYEKRSLDDLKVHQSVQLTPTCTSPVGDKKHNPQTGCLNEYESIQCSIYAA
ncbi:putative Pantothenate kinase [Tripterygium wilfordii]|uniref:pantothenate kinase n=1 Tax=Tripterygium wilfordii TaxID=458696 RepID=A0A7J7D3Z1_TRIWF|nr:pantothenate kinase 1 isoform X2 [Tripterygium wilfordii]KAF5741074.1 putative Pantothenate kinase [Tripterygium wilfordii]